MVPPYIENASQLTGELTRSMNMIFNMNDKWYWSSLSFEKNINLPVNYILSISLYNKEDDPLTGNSLISSMNDIYIETLTDDELYLKMKEFIQYALFGEISDDSE